MKYPEKKSEFRSEKLKEVALKVADSVELMKFLIARFPEKSRTAIKSMLAHKQITVDDRIVTQFDLQLKRGQTVYLNKKKSDEKPRFRGMRVVYEDADLIVIDKLAGLSTVAADKDEIRTVSYMLDQYVKRFDLKNQVFAINALERDVSGLVILAKNQKVQDTLKKQWLEAKIEVTYCALVEGELVNTESLTTQTTSSTIAKLIPSASKKTISGCRLIKTNKEYSLLEVKSVSGTKNQLPVFFKDLGFPLAGDQKNGANSNPVGQIGLHCRLLSCKHPRNGKLMRFETAIPLKFQNMFRVQQFAKNKPSPRQN